MVTTRLQQETGQSKYQIKVALDIGTSQLKGFALPVINRKTSLSTLVQRGIDAVWAPKPAHALPGKQSHTLAQPAEFAAVVGKPAKDLYKNGGLHRHADIYATAAYYSYVFRLLADLMEGCDIPSYVKYVEVDVAIGFPVSHMGRAAEVSAELVHEGQPWLVQKDNGREYSVIFNSVVSHPQPYYMAIDQIFVWHDGTLETQRGEELLANGPLFILDWGSNSIDEFFVTAALDMAGKDCFMAGTFDLLPQLRQMAYAKTKKNVPPYELMFDVFKQKKLRWGDDEFDFSQEIPELVSTQISGIREQVNLFLETVTHPYIMLLGGGGTLHAEPFLRDVFKGEFEGGVMVVKNDEGEPEPVWSIARGMVKQLIIDVAKKG